ncbi:M20 family metallopeptidase [Vibrio sp. EA2]|uniref:M20 family metallopeptidase n=1 Tax=Vibrio sp. EA2 TaxID=3079860 RepID=UPI0029491A49|nr:M20 family metallopeptidase [Vibrio sp. EA2]MDV6252298.1 M20 family metallopeptidase [Vibrio sp. EA2]
MQKWLGELGFVCDRYQRENIGDHLLFSTKSDESLPKMLLLGHLDTVFAPETFEGFSQDKYWVYGPGVCDMKGGNFVALQALRNVFALRGEIGNVDFLLVSDEETGSDDSRELTKELATNYAFCIDFEAAGENHEIVIGRKGVATYHIDLRGKAAHAGNCYAQGCDANLAAAKMMIALAELTDLAAGTTVNVGKMEGGIGANTISPQAHLTVEARFTSVEEQRRVLESIESIVQQPQMDGVKSELSGGLQRDVMVPTAAQAEFMAQIEAALGYSLLTEQRGGVSDANVVAGMGVATLDGFGPFGDGDHTHHERALKASFTRRIDEVTKILTLYSV